MQHQRKKKEKDKLSERVCSAAILLFGLCALILFYRTSFSQFFTELMSASVGTSVSVAANPYNTFAYELRQKEVQLITREQAVQARERAVESDAGITMRRVLSSSGVLFLLLLLVGIYHLARDRERLQFTLH